MSTQYDPWGRPELVRRRVNFSEDNPIDDDDPTDGMADHVTLTEYDAAGNITRTAVKLGPGATMVEGVDQVTRYTYNNLNQVLTSTQVNYTDTAGGVR